MDKFPPAFFVTGTDTDVGKTFVSAVLALGLKAKYWKPIQSGPDSDTDWIRQVTMLDEKHFLPEVYKLQTPVSPHLAAQIDRIKINIKSFLLPVIEQSHLIVEGAGGLMVPINESLFILDLIKYLSLPALVVARSTLGTINHTVLTVDKLKQVGIPVLGVVMNGPRNQDNCKAIEQYAAIPVLAEIERIENVNATNLENIFKEKFSKFVAST